MSAADRAALEGLLRSHRPADVEEASSLERIAAFAARWPDPFDRRVAEGHLTGSAFVLDPSGRLLLTHHRRLDKWLQLGGHAEAERRAEEVALREAREESGLPDLAFHPALMLDGVSPRLLDVDVHRIPERPDEPAHDHLDLRFLLVTGRPDAVVADARETRALEWVALEEARRRCEIGMRRALDRIATLVRAPRHAAR